MTKEIGGIFEKAMLLFEEATRGMLPADKVALRGQLDGLLKDVRDLRRYLAPGLGGPELAIVDGEKVSEKIKATKWDRYESDPIRAPRGRLEELERSDAILNKYGAQYNLVFMRNERDYFDTVGARVHQARIRASAWWESVGRRPASEGPHVQALMDRSDRVLSELYGKNWRETVIPRGPLTKGLADLMMMKQTGFDFIRLPENPTADAVAGEVERLDADGKGSLGLGAGGSTKPV